MPPVRKYTKELIVEVAIKMIEENGISSINARSVAAKLGCSVQPIFHNFSTMNELYQAIYQKIFDVYKESLYDKNGETISYKYMGLGYIQFARNYPELFKIIFMQETDLNAERFILANDVGYDVIEMGRKFTGLSYEEQKKFHVKVWIFTHGIACLVATKTIQFTDEEIEQLLKNSIKEMLIGYKKG